MNVLCIPAYSGGSIDGGLPMKQTHGKSLLRHTYEAACQARDFDQIIVATDSKDVLAVVQAWGVRGFFSKTRHRHGCHRVAEAVEEIANCAEVVVGLHVTEPGMPSKYLDKLAKSVWETGELSTLAGPLENSLAKKLQTYNPAEVKVVVSKSGRALYFSRQHLAGASKHLGVYGYTCEHLQRIASMPESPMAAIEQLEQVEWIDNGLSVAVIPVERSTVAVRTVEELSKWEPPIGFRHVGI